MEMAFVLSDENDLKLIVMIAAQPYAYNNMN